MSVLDRIAETDLIHSATVLHDHLFEELSSEISLDDLADAEEDYSFERAREVYLRAVATIEAGLQIGETCTADIFKLSFAEEILSHPDVLEFCSTNRLALPPRFLSRCHARSTVTAAGSRSKSKAKSKRRFALPTDGAIRSRISTIDYLKPKQRIVDAFHDATSLALDSLNHNLFLDIVRRDHGTLQGMIDTIKNEDEFTDALQTAALLETGELGVNPAALEARYKNPRWNVSSTARLLLALSRLQLVIIELGAALSAIRDASANYSAAFHLVNAHFLPDSDGLRQSIYRVTDAVAESLANLFELSAHSKTEMSSGQFTTSIPITISLVDQGAGVPLAARGGTGSGPLRAFSHEAPKVEGQHIIAQLYRHSDACSSFLLDLARNDTEAWNLRLENADEDNFQSKVRSRLPFLY